MDERERSRQLLLEADRANAEAKAVAERVRRTIEAYEDRLRNKRRRDG